jgi:hypothetical protein
LVQAPSSFSELRYFFLWASQVFAFCTILGLLAFDYETLRRNGFSLRHLTALHDISVLSAFGSSLAAALVPGIIAIVNDRVLDLLKFAAERILPQIPVK